MSPLSCPYIEFKFFCLRYEFFPKWSSLLDSEDWRRKCARQWWAGPPLVVNWQKLLSDVFTLDSLKTKSSSFLIEIDCIIRLSFPENFGAEVFLLSILLLVPSTASLLCLDYTKLIKSLYFIFTNILILMS